MKVSVAIHAVVLRAASSFTTRSRIFEFDFPAILAAFSEKLRWQASPRRDRPGSLV
jgi:hypothetical protein